MTTIDAFSSTISLVKLPVKQGDVTPVLPANSRIPREIGPYSNYPREKRLIRLYQQEFHSVETLVSTILPYVGSRGEVKRYLAGLSLAREELSITAGRFYMGGMTVPRDFMGVEEALRRCKRLAGEVLRLAGLEVLAGEWEDGGDEVVDKEGIVGHGGVRGVKEVDGQEEGVGEEDRGGIRDRHEEGVIDGHREGVIDGHREGIINNGHREGLRGDDPRGIIDNGHRGIIDNDHRGIINNDHRETLLNNGHRGIINNDHRGIINNDHRGIINNGHRETLLNNDHRETLLNNDHRENSIDIVSKEPFRDNPYTNHAHNNQETPKQTTHNPLSPRHIVFSLQHTLDLSLYETNDRFTLLFFNPFSHSLQLPLIIPLASFLCPISPREIPLFYVSRQRPDRIIQLFLPMKLPPMTTVRVYLMPCNNQTDFWRIHKMPQFSKTPQVVKNELIYGNSTTGVSLNKHGRIQKVFVQGHVIQNPPILGYYRGSTIRACRSG